MVYGPGHAHSSIFSDGLLILFYFFGRADKMALALCSCVFHALRYCCWCCCCCSHSIFNFPVLCSGAAVCWAMHSIYSSCIKRSLPYIHYIDYRRQPIKLAIREAVVFVFLLVLGLFLLLFVFLLFCFIDKISSAW